MKLWEKDNTLKDPVINKLVEDFTVGNDYLLDKQLIKYDIQASIAHARGLAQIGILSKNELGKLHKELKVLLTEVQQGKIKIKQEDEDCHTYIENTLVQKLGDLGKKIHTGRSRNDQILVALQLYMQDQGKNIEGQVAALATKLTQLAKQYADLPFPGYSHMQQAMVTSLGHYFAAYAESLFADSQVLHVILQQLNKNPLGSAAGFGVTLPLDREFTTKELGFAQLQVNSLYCQNSRGKFASLYLESLVQIMLSLSTIASDILLFTTREFAFFKIDTAFTTGSSIMPQKQNLDILEILRGKVSTMISSQLEIKILAKSLPSGYNRDFQLMKEPLLKSSETVQKSLDLISALLNNLTPQPENILAKLQPDILGADIANQLVTEQDIPFRTAYGMALKLIPKDKINWAAYMKRHISKGAAGNL